MLERKGLGGDPALSFLSAEWQAACWTHAWQMAFQRFFRSHLGWVQLLQTTLLTKPEGLLPGRREVKQILQCFSGTTYLKKKKKKKSPGWQTEVAYSLLHRLLLVQLEIRATISCSYYVWTNTQSSPPGLPKEKRDNQTLGKKEQLPLIWCLPIS